MTPRNEDRADRQSQQQPRESDRSESVNTDSLEERSGMRGKTASNDQSRTSESSERGSQSDRSSVTRE